MHDHLPTDDLIAYHRARAAGGAGLIVVEATAVHPTGLLTAHTVGGYLPAIVPVWRRMSAAVQEHGTRLVCQLFHGGREMIASGTRPPAVAPSSIPSARFKTEPRALTRAEIAEMLDGYRQAAAYAAEGGLDGVEVCAGFGYLPTQFLSRHANVRTDAVRRELREPVPVLARGARGDARGLRPGRHHRLPPDRREHLGGGNDPEDVLAAAAAVRRRRARDYLSVTLGLVADLPWLGVDRAAVAGGQERRRGFAGRVREAQRRLPLIATGRMLDPADADRLIADGVCDAVG